MYGYLENEELYRAPNPLNVEDTRVWNPIDAQYENAGYKNVIFTDSPETEEGYHAESGWEEREDRIVQVWTIVEDPDGPRAGKKSDERGEQVCSFNPPT